MFPKQKIILWWFLLVIFFTTKIARNYTEYIMNKCVCLVYVLRVWSHFASNFKKRGKNIFFFVYLNTDLFLCFVCVCAAKRPNNLNSSIFFHFLSLSLENLVLFSILKTVLFLHFSHLKVEEQHFFLFRFPLSFSSLLKLFSSKKWHRLAIKAEQSGFPQKKNIFVWGGESVCGRDISFVIASPFIFKNTRATHLKIARYTTHIHLTPSNLIKPTCHRLVPNQTQLPCFFFHSASNRLLINQRGSCKILM